MNHGISAVYDEDSVGCRGKEKSSCDCEDGSGEPHFDFEFIGCVLV